MGTSVKALKARFTRVGSEPLVRPREGVAWEAGGVFAPAVIRVGTRYLMLYRAFGADRVSRLGYAESDDGIIWERFTVPRVIPITGHSDERDGVEDPRVVQLDGHFYIIYTGMMRKFNGYRTFIRFLETDDFITYRRIIPTFRQLWRRYDKDGVLFPQKINDVYWLLHRIQPSIRISFSRDLHHWSRQNTLLRPTEHPWETRKIGAGAPPVKTPFGWLLIYHGVSEDKVYSMGAALLEQDNPSRVIARLPYPLITPARSYEKIGAVPNVIFGTSVLDLGDRYRLYYGAADFVIAAADINKEKLFSELLAHHVQLRNLSNAA